MSTHPAPAIKPRKALGQHFLQDTRVLGQIVAAAEVGPHDVVLEIGPGTGALTRRLVETGARTVAVELDRRLAQDLPSRLGNPPNLSVVEADARRLDPGEVLPPGAAYKVVGNLPYYAANPIVRKFLEAPIKPRLVVVTLQEEVAQSMTAAPGRMGLLSVAVQYYAEARLVCRVPARAFRPPPKVTSAVVRLDVRPKPAVSVASDAEFFTVVRAGFSAPRKQLRNSLAQGLGISAQDAAEVLSGAGVDGGRRPATLSLDEWALVYNAYSAWTSPHRTAGPA